MSRNLLSYSWIAGLITIFVSVCIFSYEPELHPAASYRIKNLRSTVQVFSTGNITVTGPNVQSVASAVEQIYPLLFECQKTRT